MATGFKVYSVKLRGAVRWVADFRPMGRGRKYFASKGSAEAAAQDLSNEFSQHGAAAFHWTAKERVEIAEAAKLLEPYGVSILAAAKHYAATVRRPVGIEIPVARAEFLEVKAKSGKRPRYLGQLKYSMVSFAKFAGAKKVSEIGWRDIDAWLDHCGWKPETRKSQLTHIRAFFSFCLKREYCAENPCLRVEPIKTEDKPPGILTVQQCRDLMRAALATEAGRSMIPYLALGLFAGVRPAEIQRLEWSEVNLETGLVEIKSHKSKTRQRRLVELSANCKAWLAIGGSLPPSNWQDRLEAVRKRAGVPWPHDCLRHSYCSYSLPIHGAIKTSNNAGNSEGILVRHYREVVSPQAAREFWGIVPEQSPTAPT